MMLTSLLFLGLGGLTMADLRLASRPKEGFKLRYDNRRRGVPFQHPAFPLYMEPSDFNYNGLKKQRARNYDNFLRSNIDNEQDNRNFDNEDGKDHLPFRSYETVANDEGQGTVQTKMKPANPTSNTGVTEAGNYIEVTEGEPYVVPLRWNNPHSAELEVNIWVNNKGTQKYVVPALKPTCSGEGYQDNVFDFKVPKGFPANVCDNVGDCVLQVSAHSVESRMYSSGTPVIVKGATGTWNAAAAKEPEKDVAFDLDKLRPLCLSRADPTAHHTNAVLYKARLSSDQYNHAYQNSDFSPYAGQQPQHISQNLQAACILKMTANNFGELGKRYMQKTARAAQSYANKIDKKARKLVKSYEKTTDKIINAIKENVKNNDTFPTSSLGVDDVVECEDKKGYCAKGLTCLSGSSLFQKTEEAEEEEGGRRRRRRRRSSRANAYCANEAGIKQPRSSLFQKTETCFRCQEVGSTTKRRLNTNTYIPSFEIKGKENVNKALAYINARQLRSGFLQNPAAGTMSTQGEESATLSIYMAVLTEMWKEFKMASDGTYMSGSSLFQKAEVAEEEEGGRRRRRRGQRQPVTGAALEKYKFTYRGPVIKTTTATLSDANGGVNRNYRKRDANNKKDGGYYSAAKAWSLQNRISGSSTPVPDRDGPLAQTTMYGQTLQYPPKARSGSLMEGEDMLPEEEEEEVEEEENEEDSLMEGDDMLLEEVEEEEEEGNEEENDEEEEDEDEEGGRSVLATVDAHGDLKVAGGDTVDLASEKQRPRLMRTRADGDLKTVGHHTVDLHPRLMRTRMVHSESPSE